RIETRLQRDPALRAEAEALSRAWQLLDELPKTQPSPTFATQTLDRITALRPVVSASATMLLPAAVRRVPWPMVGTVAAGLLFGWFVAGLVFSPSGPAQLRLNDPLLVRDLRVIDNLPLYAAVETPDFLQSLDDPERFGADAIGP